MEAEIQKYNSALIKKWDKKRRFDEIEQKYNVRLCTVYEMCEWLMSNDRCEDCFEHRITREKKVGLIVLHEGVTVSCLRLVRAHECLALNSNMKALWYIDVLYVSSGSYLYLNCKNIFKFTFKKILSMTSLQDLRQYNDDTTSEYKVDIDESDSTVMATTFEDLRMIATLLIYARHDVATVFNIRPPEEYTWEEIVVNFDNTRATRKIKCQDYATPGTVFCRDGDDDDDNDEGQ